MKYIKIGDKDYPVKLSFLAISWAGKQMGLQTVLQSEAILSGITLPMLPEFILRCIKSGCAIDGTENDLSINKVQSWLEEGNGLDNVKAFYELIIPAKEDQPDDKGKKAPKEKN